jgi:hypothetical protein
VSAPLFAKHRFQATGADTLFSLIADHVDASEISQRIFTPQSHILDNESFKMKLHQDRTENQCLPPIVRSARKAGSRHLRSDTFLPLIAQLKWLLLIPLAMLSLPGCQNAVNPHPDGAASVTDERTESLDHNGGHDHTEHAHPSEGPHHGDLVELGNEEYHGEVVHHNDTATLEIYILDGTATEQIAIDATEVHINLSHNGQPQQFTLTAKPDEGDEAGRSSRFFTDNRELMAHLDEKGTNPRLVVRINGKSYRGAISHSHQHGKDDHQHE